ncbi:MAG: hypothetical protein NUV51_11055 [Sulfuricaulis sp.]|nr:hypothetical protein [Sulfuricaulis sp.]
MTITSSNHNPTDVARFASGSFLDTGTVLKSIINLGWKPRYFKLWDVSGTELAFEVTDGMAAAYGYKVGNTGAQTLETSGMPSLISAYDSGTVDTWTVYETQTASDTDNSRLNLVNELFTGVSIPAALIATSVQAHWIAIG